MAKNGIVPTEQRKDRQPETAHQRNSQVPMSLAEAYTIASSIKPGALFLLNRRGASDPIAIRALQVMGVIT